AGAAVKEIVREADELSFALSHESVDRLALVEEARPGRLGDLRRQRVGARAPVEGVVALPEREPLGAVGRRDRSDRGHDGSLRARQLEPPTDEVCEPRAVRAAYSSFGSNTCRPRYMPVLRFTW